MATRLHQLGKWTNVSIKTIRAGVLRSTLVTFDRSTEQYVVKTREGKHITKVPVDNPELTEKRHRFADNLQANKHKHLCKIHRSDLCNCEE